MSGSENTNPIKVITDGLLECKLYLKIIVVQPHFLGCFSEDAGVFRGTEEEGAGPKMEGLRQGKA